MTQWYERAVYADCGKTVDAIWHLHEADFVASAERYLRAPRPWRAGLSALDIGCGQGQGAMLLAHMGYRVEAVDRNDSGAKDMAARGIAFRRAGLDRFEPAGARDLVCACDVLEHLANPCGMLRRFARWVAPGGLLYVTVPAEGRNSPNPYHVHAWTVAEIRNMLDADYARVADWVAAANYGGVWRPRGRP